jgi:hypothetical protein
MNITKLRRQIRNWIIFFICTILFFGITAFPLETELKILADHSSGMPGVMNEWLNNVYTAIHETNQHYPFLSYGTDWLAFAHIVIAMMFIGPLRNPVKNIWVIEWGIFSCLGVFPLALIAGPVRQIPFFHQMIDCSFGVIGIIPLWIVRKKILLLKELEAIVAQ